MLIGNRKWKSNADNFEDVFGRHIVSKENLTICVGFCSKPLLVKYKSQLIAKAKSGACVKIVLGMYSIANSALPSLYKDLLDLHKAFVLCGNGSDVYITTLPFHGKIYDFTSELWVGSSNFSPTGFRSQMEATVRIYDQPTQQQVRDYINELILPRGTQSFAVTIDHVNVKPRKKTRQHLSHGLPQLPPKLIPDNVSMDLPLRVDDQPESGLNLCLGKGRITKNGTYTPRPWEEVEISSDAETIKKSAYPRTPNTPPQRTHKHQKSTNQCEFNAYLYDGKTYKPCKMQTYSANNKAMGSTPRNLLGEFIKGQLTQAGLLHQPDAITSDMLTCYGRNTITLIRYTDPTVKDNGDLRNKVYVLDFHV